MNRLAHGTILLLATIMFVGVAAGAESKHPEHFVDKGECPFECCTYRDWHVDKDTVLRSEPKAKSKIVSHLKVGTDVAALTGEVHSTPGRFVMIKPYGKYKSGDELWVYTYLGEGEYRVFFDGEMIVENLMSTLRYGDAHGKSRFLPENEFGKMQEEPVSVWWVQIRDTNGVLGWTNEPDNFSNKDACG